jgi:hypothetical protein
MGEADAALTWTTLPAETRWLLSGKLAGLWNTPSDAAAFDSWALDKKQAMLLFVDRLNAKDLWNLVKRVTNVYGEDGVGLDFEAWPMIESTLSRRRDFTRVFANHHDRDGGFYEKERENAILHFLFTEGEPRRWHVHFDLYSPVHSPQSALKHVRHEMLGKMRPDWRTIAKHLDT